MKSYLAVILSISFCALSFASCPAPTQITISKQGDGYILTPPSGSGYNTATSDTSGPISFQEAIIWVVLPRYSYPGPPYHVQARSVACMYAIGEQSFFLSMSSSFNTTLSENWTPQDHQADFSCYQSVSTDCYFPQNSKK